MPDATGTPGGHTKALMMKVVPLPGSHAWVPSWSYPRMLRSAAAVAFSCFSWFYGGVADTWHHMSFCARRDDLACLHCETAPACRPPPRTDTGWGLPSRGECVGPPSGPLSRTPQGSANHSHHAPASRPAGPLRTPCPLLLGEEGLLPAPGATWPPCRGDEAGAAGGEGPRWRRPPEKAGGWGGFQRGGGGGGR